MQTKMYKIAEAIAGYTFRGALEHSDSGDTVVLQAKDIKIGEVIDSTNDMTRIFLHAPRSNAFLRRGDVVITARGAGESAFRATVYDIAGENSIASASVHILRLKRTEFLPEYIAHFLNSKIGQSQLAKIMSGVSIQVIPRSGLEQLELPAVSREQQERIILLYRNISNQRKIYIKKEEILGDIAKNLYEYIAKLTH